MNAIMGDQAPTSEFGISVLFSVRLVANALKIGLLMSGQSNIAIVS
jgi:hypothetical protein